MSTPRAYWTRAELGGRLHLSPRAAAAWVETEAPDAVLRLNRWVVRYDTAAVERLERQVRGAGEFHHGGERREP